MNLGPHRTKSLQARIVTGSMVLLSGSGLTMVINLAYNVAIARYLGTKGFGHATVVYTILTLLSSVTLAIQIVSTKLVAQQATEEGKIGVYRYFHRAAWLCGIAVAVGLIAFEAPISEFLNLNDPSLVALMAIGAGFYIPLGARRGYIQGKCGFKALATSMVLEQAGRLGGSLLLISMGMEVRGVIVANSIAIAIAYYAIRVRHGGHVATPQTMAVAGRETGQAAVFFAGQMLINNCGIVLVDHFFIAEKAGIYAAIAMVGRVIFSFSQAVVNSTFPLVAGGREEERRDLRVIATSLALVLAVGAGISIGLCFAPASIWSHLFGSGFALEGKYNLSYLLALYAFSTVVYSLGAVIVTFEMSYKITNTSWVQLAFSGVLIAGICLFHSSLLEVVLVQLMLMIVLFLLVAIPFLVNSLSSPKDMMQGANMRPIRLLSRIPEDVVISEFLKSDFHCSEFTDYHTSLRDIVLNPNLQDPEENSKRRALLFLRHLSLWKELPTDTEWYEAEIGIEELDHIRIFPRAHWRRVAKGSFSAAEIVEGIRTRKEFLDPAFVAKIDAIRKKIEEEDDPGFASVILIGLNENEPLTLLDGNHRLVSAMLSSPGNVKKLRFLCGLSPRMTDCCWYNSNLVTLFRYGRNVLTQSLRNPEAELAELLEGTDRKAAAA